MSDIANAIADGRSEELKLLLENIVTSDFESCHRQSWLSTAICHQREAIIKILLNGYGIEINSQDKQRMTPIVVAAKGGLCDILVMLIDVYGADMNLLDCKGRNVLSWAVHFRQADVVSVLINRYDMAVDAISGCFISRSPIAIAINNGFTEIFEMLVDKDRSVLEKKYTYKECGIIFFVARVGNQDIMDSLMTKYSQQHTICATDALGNTPLSYAIAYAKPDFIASLIDKYGASLYQRNLEGRPPYFSLLQEGRIQRGRLEVLELLVKTYKIDINTADYAGRGFIYHMIQDKRLKLLEIVEKNTDQPWLNQTNIHGTKLSFIASSRCSAEITKRIKESPAKTLFSQKDKGRYRQVRLLKAIIEHQEGRVDGLLRQHAESIDLEYEYQPGKTAIYYAVKTGSSTIVEQLIASGAIINRPYDDKIKSLAHVAIRGGHKNVLVKLLHTLPAAIDVRSRGFQQSLLLEAIRYNYTKIIRFLLRIYGFDVYFKSKDGISPIALATKLRMKRIVTLFLQYEFLSRAHFSPIALAIRCNSVASVRTILQLCNREFYKYDEFLFISMISNGLLEISDMFLEKYGDEMLKAKYTDSKVGVLFLAVRSDNPDIISLLIDKYGANVNERDKLLRTPLFEAVRLGNAKAVRRLLDCGANINIKNKLKQTAIFEAVMYPSITPQLTAGQIDCVKLLLGANQINDGIIKIVDSREKSVLLYGLANNRGKIVEMLWAYENNLTTSYNYWMGEHVRRLNRDNLIVEGNLSALSH